MTIISLAGADTVFSRLMRAGCRLYFICALTGLLVVQMVVLEIDDGMILVLVAFSTPFQNFIVHSLAGSDVNISQVSLRRNHQEVCHCNCSLSATQNRLLL